MRISKTDDRIQILAPAKVNLYLRLLGQRSDGYQEIDTVMCPISLCDELTLELTDSPDIELEVNVRHPPGEPQGPPAEGDLAWQIPADSRNLACRAVANIRRSLGRNEGVNMRLLKRIPAAAGLAGGSSDAAAAIVAALLAYSSWDRELACRTAASLGSDIPFFLGNSDGFSWGRATGRGEHCEFFTVPTDLDLLITHPPKGCETAGIYQHYRANNTRMSPTVQSGDEMTALCEGGDVEKIGAGLFNALQSSAATVTNWIERQLSLLRDAGAEHALMSGSGSCCFAIAMRSGIEQRVRAAAHQAGIHRVFTANSLSSPSVEHQVRHWTIR